jgi:hypothetical protein
MAPKQGSKPGATRKDDGKGASAPKAKKQLSDKELDRVAGGMVKLRAGKALKDDVK